MSHTLLRLAAVAAATIAVAAGTIAGAGAHAEGNDASQLRKMIGDPTLQTYASYSSQSTGQDAFVRMLPATSGTDQSWDFRDSVAGGTAVVHVGSGGCLKPHPATSETYVTVGGCLREAGESWEVRTGEQGTVFVHLQTETCLTRQPAYDDGTAFDPRLRLARCDGSQEQTFQLVV